MTAYAAIATSGKAMDRKAIRWTATPTRPAAAAEAKTARPNDVVPPSRKHKVVLSHANVPAG